MVGVSQNEIAGAVGLARPPVRKSIQHSGDAGITCLLPEGMNAEKLGTLLFPRLLPPVEAENGNSTPRLGMRPL